jgi:hypothetical protein
MLTLASSDPFLNILWTILVVMALVIWYRLDAPIEQTKGLAHVLWLATRQIELAVILIRGFKDITKRTIEVHRNENAPTMRHAIASLLEVGIDPIVRPEGHRLGSRSPCRANGAGTGSVGAVR